MVTALEQQTSLVHRYIEDVWVNKDLECLGDYFEKNARYQSPVSEVRGVDAIKSHFQNFMSFFTDMTVEEIQTIAQNNKVVLHFKFLGTCGNEFYGVKIAPKKIIYQGVGIFTLSQNKIQDCIIISDYYSILTQMGIVSSVLPHAKK